MVQMKDVSGSATPDEIFIFISHMVQMKDNLTIRLGLVSLSLYIPHGSDERYYLQ